MRARAVAVAVAAAALLLAGCDASAPTPEPEPAPVVDRTVTAGGGALEATGVDQDSLPFPFQDLPTYVLDFDQTPAALDGVLFGLHAAAGVLEFSAVDLEGNRLWSVQRPASCSGHTLVRAGDSTQGRALAILTDVADSTDPGALSAVTASAYDLHTGDLVWGPRDVAGPLTGPGPVFAAQPGGGAVGETGPAHLLDAATGETTVYEQTPGEALIGSYDGVVLTTNEGDLVATGQATWSVPVTDLLGPGGEGAPDAGAEVSAMPGITSPTGYALVRVGTSEVGAVLDLATGTVLDTHAVEAAWDGDAGTLVVHSRPGTDRDVLAGFTAEGPVWNRDLDPSMRIAASGGVLTYLRSDSAVQVINAMTGNDAVAYAPESTSFAVPDLIHMGAAVFSLDRLTLAGVHPQM